MRTKYKAWALPYINEHKEVMIDSIQIKNLKDYYLEIGSGKGKFLIDISNKFSNKQFIGLERNVTCAGITAKKLVESELSNAKLIFDDAERLLLSINNNSLSGIFLNFSDPWPKKRHARRRLTSPHYLKEYLRILKPGCYVYIKTDNDSLYEYSLESIVDSGFELVSNMEDYKQDEEFDTPTEYELSFIEKGFKIHRIVLKKND